MKEKYAIIALVLALLVLYLYLRSRQTTLPVISVCNGKAKCCYGSIGSSATICLSGSCVCVQPISGTTGTSETCSKLWKPSKCCTLGPCCAVSISNQTKSVPICYYAPLNLDVPCNNPAISRVNTNPPQNYCAGDPADCYYCNIKIPASSGAQVTTTIDFGAPTTIPTCCVDPLNIGALPITPIAAVQNCCEESLLRPPGCENNYCAEPVGVFNYEYGECVCCGEWT